MEEDIRFLLFLAFAGLLILLRFDAPRFGAAEYDDQDEPGGWRVGLRRLAWYLLGFAFAVAIYRLHPLPVTQLHLSLGTDRAYSLGVGIAFGIVGLIVAFAFAWYRYRAFRWPSIRHYPGAAANSVGTALIDEVAFRGAVLGLLLSFELPVELALAFQTVFYALATRLGAPGTSYAMLALSVGIGAVAGGLTVLTGGIGAGFLGHAVTRFGVFLATGHAGQVRPRGTEPEEEAAEGLPPDGWEVVTEADRARVRRA